MSNKTITTVRGTLELIFRNGQFGSFPVGTLITNIGTFACRDKWLETLDEGSYEGNFDIEEIALTGYMTRGPVREQRTFIKAVINAYVLDSMSDDVQQTDYATLDDPLFDDGEPAVKVVEPEPVAKPETAETVQVLPDWLADDHSTTDTVVDDDTGEMVTFIRDQLASVGETTPWRLGEAIAIPADLGRQEQRKIRDYLVANGYKMADPMTRTWDVKEVANA